MPQSSRKLLMTSSRLSQYFRLWLGTEASTERSMIELVENGLPTSVIHHLIDRGLSKEEVYGVIINPRTLKHRKSRREPLSSDESERAIRTARILARAQAVFGDETAALAWLRAPKKRFEGRSPIQMIGSEVGGKLVEEMLIQIDQGIYA